MPSSTLETLLPESIWREPQPLVAIIGEVDWDPGIHKRLSNALNSVGMDQHGTGTVTVPICYQSLPSNYSFPPRKAYHPMKASNGQPMDGYSVRGILKTHWPQKHAKQIPSVVILVCCAEMHWGPFEWGARETAITGEVERLRAAVSAREIRIFTAIIKRGVGDDREWDERIMALRRRANLDHRAVYVLSDPQDLSPMAMNMRRFYKELRERTTTYYLGHGKRIKRWEGGLNPSTQMPLIARYRFKQAFFYEFLGNVEKVIKHYRRAFEALGEMMKLIGTHGEGPTTSGLGSSGHPLSTPSSSSQQYAMSAGATLGGWSSQVRALAELVSFKVCYYAMRETQHGEAVRQFRALMDRFHWSAMRATAAASSSSSSSLALSRSLVSSPSSSEAEGGGLSDQQRLEFLHHEWVSRQYELFGELWQRFPSPQLAGFGSITTSLNLSSSAQLGDGSDCYSEADVYIYNSALYMSRRRACAQALRQHPRAASSKYSVRLASNFDVQGPLLRPPYFFGGRPRLAEPSLEEGVPDPELANLVQAVMERDEMAFDHSAAVRSLLERALVIADPSRPRRHRFKAIQHLKLADELSSAQLMSSAWEHYRLALQLHDEERSGGWPETTVSILQRARVCALSLGKRLDHLDLSLKLLSNRLASAVPPALRRSLFLEALYLLTRVAGLEPTLRASLAESGGEEVSILSTDYGKHAGQVGQPQPHTPASRRGGRADDDDDVDASGPGPYEPMCTATPDSIEVSLGCPFRQLLSFSVTFPTSTAALGTVCPLTLRLVSHLPLPLHASSLHLRFNQDYAGAITVLDPSPLSALDRLAQSWATPPPAPPDAKSSSLANHHHPQQQQPKVVHAPLLLLPGTPLDLHLALPIPGENVEVGDVIHATQLKLSVALPAGEDAGLGRPSQLCFNLPSGVKHIEGLGVIMHSAIEEASDGSMASEPSTLPVPIRSPVRGFPSVEVVRPTARATVSLAPQQPSSVLLQGGGPSSTPVVAALVEGMQLLVLQVQSHEDLVDRPKLFVRTDPPPRSSRPDDAVFFTLTPEGTHQPLPLGKDLQPEEPLLVLPGSSQEEDGGAIAPHSTLHVPIWFRPTREGRSKINAVLVYKSVKDSSSSSSSSLQQPASPGGGASLSSLMISSDLVVDVESHVAFQAGFEVASPAPCEVHPKPGNAEGQVYSFFTGEEVVMRLGVRVLAQPGLPETARIQVKQVVWHLEDPLSSPALVRGISQPTLPKEGKVVFDAGDAPGEGRLQANEVMSTSFHFLCPEKETSHPIRLGRVRIHWLVEDEDEDQRWDGVEHCRQPSRRWVGCSEVECPFVTVLRPDLAVDLEAPLEAKFGEAFSLRWKVLNTSAGVLSARVVIQDPPSASPIEAPLLWGGRREFVIQLLPNRSIAVPLMVVPLATGPLAIPRISLVPVADAVSAFDPSATSFRVSIRSADNMPQAGGQAGDGGRYVFVMPAHPSSATTAAS